MNTASAYPSLEEFLAAPIERVRQIAPATLILTNGGTRRRAALAGISPTSVEYARWTRQQMVNCFDLIFRHGVGNIISTVLAESNYNEETIGYREQLVHWTNGILAGQEALSDYVNRGWRVHLVGTETWPELKPAADQIRQRTAYLNGPNVWLTVASYAEACWDTIFSTDWRKEV